MHILRAANYKVMPWKNGMGSTTEIAIFPPHAALDDFAWRVSMAQVTSDGPFSVFPGIDRTLLILGGNGIALSVAGHKPVTLDRESLHSFPGDQPTSATLIDGPIIDLNIMSRRDVATHQVRRVNVVKHQDIMVSTQTLLFVTHGTLTVPSASMIDVVSTHDTLLIDPQSPTLTIETTSLAHVVVIEFR